MVWRRPSYTTKVVLTTKVLFAPRFAFSSFIPPWLPLHPIYMRPPRMDNASQCCVRYGTVVSTGPWHHFDVGRVKKSSPRAIIELSVEMVRPRFAASVLTGVGVVSSFRGVYARVARKLKVSPSMVSRVADGHRISPKIQAALREELHAIKQKLDSIF
jgi:hypothetical protein